MNTAKQMLIPGNSLYYTKPGRLVGLAGNPLTISISIPIVRGNELTLPRVIEPIENQNGNGCYDEDHR